MLFVPKSSLYYLAEENLKKFDVVVSKETLRDSLFSLNVENLDVSTKGIESAKIDSVELTFLGVYNSVKVKEIELSSIVEAYFPSKIKSLDLEYSFLHPLTVHADSVGKFGEISATFNLLDLELNATLKPSQLMLKKYRRSLHFFKKSKEGEYLYAKAL